MNLEEAKDLFKKHHAKETSLLNGPAGTVAYDYAASVWHGFKSALKLTDQLKEK